MIWTNGVQADLPALGGGKIAYGRLVNGINNKGDLVGYAPAPQPGVFTIAVLWRKGKIINLGHYPGGTNSYATGINRRGPDRRLGQPGARRPAPRAALDGDEGRCDRRTRLIQRLRRQAFSISTATKTIAARQKRRPSSPADSAWVWKIG